MLKRYIILLLSIFCLSSASFAARPNKEDAKDLGIAIDYFQSGKYHEALLYFARLDSLYRLNPRFRAYTALCYYYDGDNRHAVRIFDVVLPQLTAFSPSERSVYYRANADAHQQLGQLDEAAAAYDSLLVLCHDNEKAEAYFQRGVIRTQQQQWLSALDDLQSALVYYRRYQPEAKARIAQIRNMIVGCCDNINQMQDKRTEP